MKPRSLNDESESIWHGYALQFGPLIITVPDSCVELVGCSPNGKGMDLNFILDWSRPKMRPKADTRFSCSWIVCMLLPIDLRSSAKLMASSQGSCSRFLWMVRARRSMSYSDNQISGLPVPPWGTPRSGVNIALGTSWVSLCSPVLPSLSKIDWVSGVRTTVLLPASMVMIIWEIRSGMPSRHRPILMPVWLGLSNAPLMSYIFMSIVVRPSFARSKMLSKWIDALSVPLLGTNPWWAWSRLSNCSQVFEMRLYMMPNHSLRRHSISPMGRRFSNLVSSFDFNSPTSQRYFYESGICLSGHMRLRSWWQCSCISAGQCFMSWYEILDIPGAVCFRGRLMVALNSSQDGGSKSDASSCCVLCLPGTVWMASHMMSQYWYGILSIWVASKKVGLDLISCFHSPVPWMMGPWWWIGAWYTVFIWSHIRLSTSTWFVRKTSARGHHISAPVNWGFHSPRIVRIYVVISPFL